MSPFFSRFECIVNFGQAEPNCWLSEKVLAPSAPPRHDEHNEESSSFSEGKTDHGRKMRRKTAAKRLLNSNNGGGDSEQTQCEAVEVSGDVSIRLLFGSAGTSSRTVNYTQCFSAQTVEAEDALAPSQRQERAANIM